jgi:flagellar export protein FliJ
MAFRFNLQTLLRLRESIERREESRLQQANQQVAAIRNKIENLDRYSRNRKDLLGRALQNGSFAAELQFELYTEHARQNARNELSKELSRLQTLRDQQQHLFYQARMQHETLDALREQQLRSYTKKASRETQRLQDESVLLRRHARSSG